MLTVSNRRLLWSSIRPGIKPNQNCCYCYCRQTKVKLLLHCNYC